MIDLSKISGFDWDAGNRRKSIRKHDVSSLEAEQIFFNDPLVVKDIKHSTEEPRLHALGQTDDGRFLHISFTVRKAGTSIRVISARSMNRKERLLYVTKT